MAFPQHSDRDDSAAAGVLTSFLFMHYFGISSNIMSLGGIAIAIGVLVDAGIVMTENVIRHAEQHSRNMGSIASQIGEITLHAATTRGPADLLLDGDHHPRLRSGLCTDRNGRKALSSARIHENVRDGRIDNHRRDACSGALHVSDPRPSSSGRPQSGHAVLARDLSARFLRFALRQRAV